MNLTATPRSFAPAPLPATKFYDLLAAVPLVIWYFLNLVADIGTLREDLRAIYTKPWQFLPLLDLLLTISMLSFAAIVIFMLFRRLAPVAKTQGIFPRVAAIVGTYLCVSFVLLPHHTGSWQMQLVSLLFMLGGEGFAIYSISWLGRSFSIMPEARCLVTGGPYAIVRHPLYLGEQIALFGVLLQYASPAKVAILAVALFALQFTFQLVRMGNEEQVLSTAYPEYAFYKMRTARILPGIY